MERAAQGKKEGCLIILVMVSVYDECVTKLSFAHRK